MIWKFFQLVQVLLLKLKVKILMMPHRLFSLFKYYRKYSTFCSLISDFRISSYSYTKTQFFAFFWKIASYSQSR
jgi:hypothetical protein